MTDRSRLPVGPASDNVPSESVEPALGVVVALVGAFVLGTELAASSPRAVSPACTHDAPLYAHPA